MVDGEEVWGSFKPGGGGYDMMNGCTVKPLGVMNLSTYLSLEKVWGPKWIRQRFERRCSGWWE